MALILPTRYPGRFNPGNAAYPQGSFKNRSAPGALDGSYLEQDWANDKEGFFQRLMSVAGLTPNGVVDTATASQYYDALLAVIAANAADKFNAAIATIASAATVNLTTGAPNTSQIAISGTATITGFTVATNRTFVVKFTGACTLTNNAAIVTGTGANIVMAAGDSCIIRATAANTVEVIFKDLLQDRGLGSGQSWQNLTGSRTAGTTYTNTTGRSIQIIVNANGTNSARVTILVNGTAIIQSAATESGGNTENVSCSIPIPPLATYSFQFDLGGALSSVWELR